MANHQILPDHFEVPHLALRFLDQFETGFCLIRGTNKEALISSQISIAIELSGSINGTCIVYLTGRKPEFCFIDIISIPWSNAIQMLSLLSTKSPRTVLFCNPLEVL